MTNAALSEKPCAENSQIARRFAAIIVSLGLAMCAEAATTYYDVSDVLGLTNALKEATSPKVIRLAKGVYDISGCKSEDIVSNYTSGRLTFASGYVVTLAGAEGTKRGDVILDSKGAGRRMLYMNKGTLTLTNLTWTGSSGGVLQVGNSGAKVYFYDCVFSNNTASSAAVMGRYYEKADTKSVNNFYNCLFADNHATTGGQGAHVFRGGYAYDCVYTNNTSTGAGGAVTSGNYIRCRFYNNSTATTSTNQGGGAIGEDYDTHRGFCTDCVFVGNSTTSGQGAHGAAVYGATAFTNCVFRKNESTVNDVVYGLGSAEGCVFEENEAKGAFFWGAGKANRCKFFRNKMGSAFNQSSLSTVNCLFASNTCTSSSGIITAGRQVNSTFIGNYCTSGAVSDSIIGYSCVAINCLFYQNRAHNVTYNDMAMRKTKNDGVCLNPWATNCIWTAETVYSESMKTECYARTKGCKCIPADKIKILFPGEGDRFYELRGRSPARDGGYEGDGILDYVGELDLAKGTRRMFDAIDIGCYELQKLPGLMLLVR